MSAIETFEHAGLTIKIYYDDSCSSDSPRDWGRSGTFYMERGSSSIQPDGDADDGIAYNYAAYRDGDYPEDVQGKIAAHNRIGSVVIPVQYAHEGGVKECDEDQADGYIYLTREQVLAEFPRKIIRTASVGVNHYDPGESVYYKRVTPKLRKIAEDYLCGEIEIYNQWARGDVYGYRIKDSQGETVDSLWSMYGFDYCVEAAKEAAEYEAKRRAEERAERLVEHNRILDEAGSFWLRPFAFA